MPLRLLDRHPSGASYYLAYPPANGGAMTWSDYGRVLLDLGDQVLLRTAPSWQSDSPSWALKSCASR